MSKGIQKMFSEVPGTYEFVNHILTLGFDIAWRRRSARTVASLGTLGREGAGPSARLLDICTGTGETAVYLRRWTGPGTEVVAADFTPQMLATALSKKDAAGIGFILADARSLPFPDNSFDGVTLSFATRNLNTDRANLLRCFTEFHRILKPGATFVNLETSQPRSSFIRKGFHTYVRLLVKPIGSGISRSNSGYAYLSRTIPRFYSADELAGILRQAGFARVSFRRMLLGVAAIHRATK